MRQHTKSPLLIMHTLNMELELARIANCKKGVNSTKLWSNFVVLAVHLPVLAQSTDGLPFYASVALMHTTNLVGLNQQQCGKGLFGVWHGNFLPLLI